jgi:hypothetical protein
MFVISGDFYNANLETEIIATAVKLTSTALIMQEGFEINLRALCVSALLPGGGHEDGE